MKVKVIAPWFGSNRMLGPEVGKILKGCSWVGVPFAGGMAEVAHLDARTIAVNDLHRHVINLARVIASDEYLPVLIQELDEVPFHPDALQQAQQRCRLLEEECFGDDLSESPSLSWAIDYFVSTWMSRNGKAGTKDEFDAGLSFRWEAGGGDSATRFRNATESLKDWSKVMRRCTFSAIDVADFLEECRKRDRPEHGLYLDPPFPGPGDAYKHKFSLDAHTALACDLASFQFVRIVCRFYDHPLIRSLYPETIWEWRCLEGRTQTNASSPEVLLVRKRGKS